MTIDYVLTIDPGLNIGWALWHGPAMRGHYTSTKIQPPIRAGTVKAPGGKRPWEFQVLATLQEFYEHMDDSRFRKVKGVHIEVPEFVKGAAVKVGYVAGAVAMWGVARNIMVGHVGVNEWKGNLSKENTEIRIVRVLEGIGNTITGLDEHAVDAVGIGLHLQGVSFG